MLSQYCFRSFLVFFFMFFFYSVVFLLFRCFSFFLDGVSFFFFYFVFWYFFGIFLICYQTVAKSKWLYFALYINNVCQPFWYCRKGKEKASTCERKKKTSKEKGKCCKKKKKRFIGKGNKVLWIGTPFIYTKISIYLCTIYTFLSEGKLNMESVWYTYSRMVLFHMDGNLRQRHTENECNLWILSITLCFSHSSYFLCVCMLYGNVDDYYYAF